MRRLHGDGLRDPGELLARGHGEDPVRIHLERDGDAGKAGGQGRNARKRELRQRSVVRHQLALPLQHVDVHPALAVGEGGEFLRRAHRDGRVAQDQLLHQAAHGLQTEGERSDVEEQHVVLRRLRRQQVGLHRRAERHHLVGIDVRQRLHPEQLAHVAAHGRHPRGSTDEDDAVEPLAFRHARVAQCPAGRPAGLLDQRTDGGFELRPGHALAHGLGNLDPGEVFLRLLGGVDGLADLVRSARLIAEQNLRKRAIEVVAAQRGIAAHRLDFEHARLQLEDGDVERATAEIVDGELPFGTLVEAVRERGGGRLVEQPEHFQPGEPPRLLRCLPLRVVEVGRNGDHRLVDLDPEPLLGPGPQCPQDLGGDFDGIHHPAAVDHEADDAGLAFREPVRAQAPRLRIGRRSPHEPLHGDHGVARELRSQPPCSTAHDHGTGTASRSVMDRRRQQRASFVDGERVRLPVAEHDGDEGVGGAEIDPDGAARAGFLGVAFSRLADLEEGHQSSTERPSTSSR